MKYQITIQTIDKITKFNLKVKNISFTNFCFLLMVLNSINHFIYVYRLSKCFDNKCLKIIKLIEEMNIVPILANN